tara:strand:+ start:14939 stop:15763 length:825 start_codon:yes stop_codon:yes gene_type:complete
VEKLIKVAGVQMDVAFNDPNANLKRMKSLLASTSANGAVLTVFPECALSGYCFESKEEAMENAQSVPGPAVEAIAQTCKEYDTYAVFGMLEKDADDLFNVCVLLGPEGLIAKYRKAHLPSLGVDNFATPGNEPFAVCEAGGLRIGMNICYDYSFPEAARVLMLQGADLIVLPTNWPEGSRKGANYLINARAHENHIYYLAVDRVGSERGFDFIGLSKCCEPSGDVIAEADHNEEAIIYAGIDPSYARQKHLVRIPGKHEVHRIKDRRPDLYSSE